MGVKILIAPQMGVVSREPRVPDTSLSHIIVWLSVGLAMSLTHLNLCSPHTSSLVVDLALFFWHTGYSRSAGAEKLATVVFSLIRLETSLFLVVRS